MKINDLLKESVPFSKIITETYTIHGLVSADTDPELVRIYRDLTNRGYAGGPGRDR